MTVFLPELSLKERDRRWKAIRDCMKANGLDCLVVFGLKSLEEFDSYLTNLRHGGVVIFPLEGDPVYLVRVLRDFYAYAQRPKLGLKDWIHKYRPGTTWSTSVTLAIKEEGLEESTIGVVGYDGFAFDLEGWVPYKTWSYIQENLPRAKFRPFTKEFAEVMLVKSPEELRCVERAAEIGEHACEVMLRETKLGIRESHVYAKVMESIFGQGATTKFFLMSSGEAALLLDVPDWNIRGGPPPIIKSGMVINSEMAPTVSSLETEQQQSIAVGSVDRTFVKCAEISYESLQLGLKAMRPGVRFSEVANAMNEPLERENAWYMTPLIHGLNPMFARSPSWRAPSDEKLQLLTGGRLKYQTVSGDVVIKAGMTFEVQPSACIGDKRVSVGGTAIVTDSGCRLINKLGSELRYV